MGSVLDQVNARVKIQPHSNPTNGKRATEDSQDGLLQFSCPTHGGIAKLVYHGHQLTSRDRTFLKEMRDQVLLVTSRVRNGFVPLKAIFTEIRKDLGPKFQTLV